jgi:asparagine synthase (glutamine-hydrolysing)
MCGIAAVIGAGEAEPGVRAMVEAVRHRGPDDSGVVQPAGRPLALGCARLAIIDLSPAGHMPMTDPATGNVIAYNGEVYNFRELRRDLEAEGERFRSGTDTEVLLRAYAIWGRDFVERLRGMFAFALWDAGRREVLLARDRLGEKPLYYAPGPPLVAASEVRALLATGLVSRRLDPAALDSYLVNGFVVSPRTILRDVLSLLPGHLLAVAEDGRVLEERRYWRLPAPGAAAPAAEAAARLRSDLERSVTERLISDVPLGAFLSGGLDSTTVVALMTRAGGEVRTFSVTFEDPVYDESAHSRRAAERFRTRHTEVRLTRDEFEARMDAAVAALDQPSFDGMNTYFVSRAARESGLTVALSGTGADELFGGYPFFRQVERLERARRLWARTPGAGGAAAWASERLRRVSGPAKVLDLLAADVPRGLETLAAYQAVQTLFPDWSRRELLG